MSERKLTLEITVDQNDTATWAWFYASLRDRSFINGVKISRLSDDWLSEQFHNALMESNNMLVDYKRDNEP